MSSLQSWYWLLALHVASCCVTVGLSLSVHADVASVISASVVEQSHIIRFDSVLGSLGRAHGCVVSLVTGAS